MALLWESFGNSIDQEPIEQSTLECLPAIVPLHLALVAIELVVGAADKLTLPAAYLVTERGGATVLRRDLNHPLAASLTLQMAEGPKCTHKHTHVTHTWQTFKLANDR